MTATLRALVGLTDAPWRRIALSALLGTLALLFGIGLMATAGYLIARAAEHPPVLSLTVAIVAVRFFGLARPLARYLERLVSHDLAFRVLARVRSRVYARIEPLAPAELEAFRHGDLVSRMVGDVEALQDLHLRGLLPMVVAVGSGCVAVGVTTAIAPVAGAVLAAGLTAGAIAVPVVARRFGRTSGRRAMAQGQLAAELVELLRGAPELVVYGREGDALHRVRAADRELVRMARRDALAAGVAEGLGVLITGATVVGVLAVAVTSADAGALDGVLVTVLALVALASFDAVGPLPQAMRELSETLAAGRRVLELTRREPAVRDPADPLPAPRGSAIGLEGVVARYSPDAPPVLDGVSLELEPGAKIALVGPSGAGKTTIVNLLLRFLDPVAGRVTLDGRDLRDYRQEDVRRTIAVAGQDAHLFSTSIRENVRLAKPMATDAEVADALERARILDWIETLPEGMDTLVGEEGDELSGGQRQRIALARALLADASVLVLDEPTSHLDSDLASSLVTDLLAAADGRSVLLVTHRPEGLELVDDVVVLDVVRAPE